MFRGGRKKSKSPGAYCEFLPASKNAFIIANFSPSFNAVIALIHEMGHALNEYLQFINDHGPQEMNRRFLRVLNQILQALG